ncbi:MAG: tetratricopeptide repeat protein [Terracidiphilus sp.]
MPRSNLYVLLLVSIFSLTAGLSQTPAKASEADQPLSREVVEAEAAIASSNWSAAQAKLTPWLAANPTDARALFDAAYVADAQNHLEDAAGLYRRALEANPSSFEAHIELGLLLARQGKLDDARPELAAATQLDPGPAGAAAKARAWRALAQIDREGNPAQASIDLLEALKLSPETPADTLLAAELADKTGQPDAAEAAYRRILAADPKSAPADAGLAHLLIARKKFPEAETLLRGALELAPEDEALTAQLATVLAAEDKAEALPLLQKLHTAHPKDPAITRMLAEVLDDAGEFAEADKLYGFLLAINPNDSDLLVAHGQDLTRQKEFAEAFVAFDKATRLDAANADGWSGLAFAASRTNRPEITLHALTMRSKYLPEIPSTYFLWATAYDTLHQKTAAATYYHHFLDAAAGKYPNQEWQARQRLLFLEAKK